MVVAAPAVERCLSMKTELLMVIRDHFSGDVGGS